MRSLSVIIVNYNVKFFLEQCLCSLRKAGQGLDMDIRVVDNASTDGSRDYLSSRFPEVIFYWNNRNLGFAKANNQALADAGGDIVLFLNPDTIIPEQGLRDCLAYLDAHPRTGALGVHMLDGYGRFLKESRRGFPDPLTALSKLTGLASLFPRSRIFARYHMGHLDPSVTHPTDVLAGAFFMVRGEVLAQTGGFDEAFFMYGEDIDLSYRIQQAGWENTYFAGCTIIHFKGESTRKGSLDYLRMFYGAMAVFARKHYGRGRASLLAVGLQAGIWLRGAISVVGNTLRRIASLFIPASAKQTPFMVVGHAPGYSLLEELRRRYESAEGALILVVPPAEDLPDVTAADILVTHFDRNRCRDLCCIANGLSYATIIALAETLSPKLRLRIHAMDSGSVAGPGESFAIYPAQKGHEPGQ
jgi:GT2 family glycosyltransferase